MIGWKDLSPAQQKALIHLQRLEESGLALYGVGMSMGINRKTARKLGELGVADFKEYQERDWAVGFKEAKPYMEFTLSLNDASREILKTADHDESSSALAHPSTESQIDSAAYLRALELADGEAERVFQMDDGSYMARN